MIVLLHFQGFRETQTVCSVSYGSSFFSPSIYGQSMKEKKKLVCNLQYGPQTWLVRCMYWKSIVELQFYIIF